MTVRYRHGLAKYKAPRPGAAAKARRPPAKVRGRLLPGPSTNAAHRLWTWALGPMAGWSQEARALKDAALADALGRKGYEGSKELWAEYQDAHYRRRYHAQQRERPKAAHHPSAWVKVRAYRRRRPGAK